MDAAFETGHTIDIDGNGYCREDLPVDVRYDRTDDFDGTHHSARILTAHLSTTKSVDRAFLVELVGSKEVEKAEAWIADCLIDVEAA